MKVKICGIKSLADAMAAVRAGADALGFLVGQVHPGTDFLALEEARAIVSVLPQSTTSVLVTHFEDSLEVIQLIRELGVGAVQIHSEMSPAGVHSIRKAFPHINILKSFHVTGEEVLSYGEVYENMVDGFVLDSLNRETGQVGGTGLIHDWDVSAEIVNRYERPVILAGGLSPDNVRDAIRRVRPYGVDVNSGTKGSDGFKDIEKVNLFISEARTAR